MPLIHTTTEETHSIGVWRVAELEESLFEGLSVLDSERLIFDKITNPRRRIEWIVVRKLVCLLAGLPSATLVYNNLGKPSLDDGSFNISVSHSRDLIAVLVSKTEEVGIDIEKIETRIQKIANKFIGPEEESFLHHQSLNSEQMICAQYIIWCAKECLFKIYSKGELDFKQELFVSAFQVSESFALHANIHKLEFQKQYTLNGFFRDDYVLVWVVD